MSPGCIKEDAQGEQRREGKGENTSGETNREDGGRRELKQTLSLNGISMGALGLPFSRDRVMPLGQVDGHERTIERAPSCSPDRAPAA